MSRLLDFCTINGRRIEIREDAPDAFSVHDADPFDQAAVPSVWTFRGATHAALDAAVNCYLNCRDVARCRPLRRPS